ncbi:MBL fold metallo-hydrolase [Usitatibacter palustris]|uniref:Metallo-hydrolase YycJ n=1 Tax=Usitatibacter palustris TaxID=2732487 RepID=A0A6M4H5E5_9PROT|nr:MBL fold metallo-hydrolase [Usitatibacter palustris]QJR14385.1 Putative metallo-hydrolase YycJ [Usitatibacter palustris]
MRFSSLGSGSLGNALVVERGTTRVMMDCGFSITETKRRLERAGLAPADLTAIVVTHEHDDHLGGVAAFAKRFAVPVYLTRGTAQWLPDDFPRVLIRLIDSHTVFAIGELQVEPFAVPHDAREPVQYVFGDGASRIGVVTDLGTPTQHVAEKLTGCDALVLECNHDRDMLMNGPYTPSLKLRVGGRFGHLSNADAAALLAHLDRSRMKHVIAAHLSQQNNTRALAAAALAQAMGCEESWIGIAAQDEGFAWRDV